MRALILDACVVSVRRHLAAFQDIQQNLKGNTEYMCVCLSEPVFAHGLQYFAAKECLIRVSPRAQRN